MTFVEWASAQLAKQGKQLTPAQAILCAVAFDGRQPWEFLDRPETAVLFGKVQFIPDTARRVLVAAIGARSGKSFLLGALYSTYAALTCNLDNLAAGEQAVALILAPDLKTARHTLRYVAGLQGVPMQVTGDCIEVFRNGEGTADDSRSVRIECLAASSGGRSLRGRWYVSAFFDEAAFFRDSNSVVNDEDCFEAILPRLLPGAVCVLSSTPWIKSGLHYDLFRRNREKSYQAIAVHAPTLTMRPDDPQLAADIEALRVRKPDVAAREYDCEWIENSREAFFDGALVDAACARPAPQQIVEYTCGADLAHVKDSCCFVVLGWPGPTLVEAVEWRPDGSPLSYRDIVPAMCKLAAGYGCCEINADHFEIYAAQEHTVGYVRFKPIAGGASGKMQTHTAAREALLAASIPNTPKGELLAQQLKSVRAELLPGGEIRLTAARVGGRHGDLASAWICAVGGSNYNRDSGQAELWNNILENM